MRRALVLFAFLLGPVLLAWGCSLALGFDHYSDNADCPHAFPPQPPAQSGGGKEASGFIAAFSYLTIDGKDRSGKPINVGYDLDNACTCPGAVTCKSVTNTPLQNTCDDPGGRDNATKKLLDATKAIFLVTDASFNSGLKSGLFTGIVRIDNYNGTPNDDSVDVAFYNGLKLANGGAPTFQNDAWLVEDSGVLPANGWVTNGTLVVKYVSNAKPYALRFLVPLPQVDAGTNVAPIVPFAMSTATLTATISITGGKLSLTNGQLAGTIPMNLAMGIAIATGNCSFGATAPRFQATLDEFCNYADLGDDKGICNALSFGIGFEAVPASISGMSPSPQGIDQCDGGSALPTCTQVMQ